MTPLSIGDISLAEYQRLVRRPNPWPRRAALIGLVLLSTIGLTAAADFLGVWKGRHSRTMPPSLAVEVLDSRPSEKWQSDIAMGVIYAEVEKLISKIGASAQSNPQNVTYAALYLRNAALASVRQIKSITANVRGAGPMTAHFDTIRKEMGGD